jgi:uncharacterized protein with ACT and thioredoxin-like domain
VLILAVDSSTPVAGVALAEITGIIAARGINIINTVVYYDEKKFRYKTIIRIEELNGMEIATQQIFR